MSRWLALAVAVLPAACNSPGRPPELSQAAQRSLTDAIRTQDNASAAALGSLREAARRAPDDAAAQQSYGLAAEQEGLYAEALAALDRAVALGGAAPDRLGAQGRIALEAGDVPAASRAYTRMLELDPVNVDALDGLGVTEDLKRDHTQARARYQDALRLAPGNWKVRSNLAMSYLMSGHGAEAATALAGAEHDPSAPRRARHDLALALVASGKRGQAIDVLTTDMPAAEASVLADEFASFARWLASPEASRPPLR